MTTTQLERTTFKTSRLLEFFSEKELQMQIGHSPQWWPIALLKELIDNALDACETAGVLPEIEVIVEQDAVSVRDNGPGLPASTLEHSLDYLVRVSDKAYYVSPTRGQLGNALKCVWAAPYVVSGEQGRIDVGTQGQTHHITVELNRISQEPELSHAIEPDGLVKNGTLVKMHWPGIAGYLNIQVPYSSYNAEMMLINYATFNPHARFTYRNGKTERVIEPTTTEWPKWRPNDPTSPHWYTVDRLRALIAAYLSNEHEGGRARTVREFVSEFRGLSGTAKQKVVTDAAGLTGAYLHDLIDGIDVHQGRVEALLSAMTNESREVKPGALGVLGEDHLAQRMVNYYCIDRDTIKYKKIEGTADGVPFAWEVAFGIYEEQYKGRHSAVAVGLNWTPAIKPPISELTSLLGEQLIHRDDHVALVVHLACPRMEYTDRGKGVLSLSPPLRQALEVAVVAVTPDWKKAKRQANREGRVRQRDMERMRKARKAREWNIKEAAYHVMERAYMKASANNTLPANARQIMYAARPLVLELTNDKCWANSSYFTQHLLPDFVEEYPTLTANWDVVFDARGHVLEPHTREDMGLGTLEVRRYISRWKQDFSEDVADIEPVPYRVPTFGPGNRYQFVLFVEKEGFNHLLQAACFAERYDLGVMSTKGMSVTAARQLVEELSGQDVTILVLHDFDKAGFSIVNTLRSDTRRYSYTIRPRVVDIGLRLSDVREMQLQSEPVQYDGKKDPRINLRQSGATEEECNFLVKQGFQTEESGQWWGERVELNAMTSNQFVIWLEGKLKEVGVEKVVPNADTLAKAYRRALRRAAIQKIIDEAIDNYEDEPIDVPDNLVQRIRDKIEGTEDPWDYAVWKLALSRSEAV